MKHSTVLIGASTFVAVTLLMFLAGAFIAASFDITAWGPIMRFHLAVIWLIFAPMISLFAAMFTGVNAI